MKLVFSASAQVAEWTRERIPGVTDWGLCSAIGICEGGAPLAGVVYSNYRPGLCMDMSVAAQPKARWLTVAVLAQIFRYPFVQMDVGRVQSFIPEGNERSESLCRRLGFTAEGRMREGWYDGRDLLIYGMLRRECRWLRKAVLNG